MSNPTITTQNLDIGPCIVNYNGVDLGSTLDKVVVTMKYVKSPLHADQTGSTILDAAISGIDISVAFALAETRDKTKVAAIFPNMDYGGTSPADFLDMKNKVAVRDFTQSKVLFLHPIVEVDAGLNFDWYFYNALSTEESALTISASDQYKMKVSFRIYPDTSVSPMRFFRYGDQSL